MNDLCQKISSLSIHQETLERICHSRRDETQNIMTKVDSMRVELQNLHGEFNVQTKMVQSQMVFEKMVLSFIN